MDMIERVGKALRRPFCRHDWQDQYLFESVRQGERVLGVAMLLWCPRCDATSRRPIRTWREARTLRKLGY